VIKIRFLAVFLSTLILMSTVIPSISAEETTESEQPRERIIDIIAKLFFENTVDSLIMPWHVLRFVTPDPFTPDNEYIEIGFYDTASVVIGVVNESSGEYKSLEDFDYTSLFPSSEFELTIEYPDYLPEDYFIAKFDPQILHLYKEGEAKTKLTIISKVPDDAALPENIVLRVNITKYITAQNTYLPPKGNRGIFTSAFWFLAAIGVTFPLAFGPYYSGKRVADYSTYVDIIVKLKRTHLIDVITPTELVELNSDSIYSIPIEIKNFGSHIDTFNFRATSSSGNKLTISPPPAITLGPNEKATVTLGIATSDELWDPGTLHSVKVEAYSIYEPDLVFNNTVSLVTKGLYVSEANIAPIAFGSMLIIILIAAIFLVVKQRKIKEKVTKKSKKKKVAKKTQSFLSRLKLEKKDEIKHENKPAPAKKKEEVKTEIVKEKPVVKPRIDLEAKKERLKRQKAIERIKRRQKK